MNVHFVCTGNVYRSRLGEAYLNSKQLAGIQATSSGIFADLSYDYDGPIFWGAMRLIFKYSLTPFMSAAPTQTTLQLLTDANLIIFMKRHHLDYSKKELGWLGTNFEIWDIEDMDLDNGYESIEDFVDPKVIPITEKTFGLIKEKVDNLARRLQK